MPKKDNLLKGLQATKRDFHTAFTLEEEMEAFRKQVIILDELTRTVSEPQILTELRAQFKNQNFTGYNPYKAFIKSRCHKVQNLQKGATPRRRSVIGITGDKFLPERGLYVEPTCSGKYKSCHKNEVNADDVKIFSKKVPWRKVKKAKSPIKEVLLNSELGKATLTEQSESKISGFRTAREELIIQNAKKNGGKRGSVGSRTALNYGASKKSLGARRNVRSNFVPPVQLESKSNISTTCTQLDLAERLSPEPQDERLKNIDPKMIKLISNEIMHKFNPISWKDIAGLEYAKSIIKEAVVWPLLRPDIFTGLRRPPRGILLFGPPGTGKTLIGKCIACQSKATFFSISASSLTSKWVGDGEKMVRALFAVAAVNQPSVVFIDEIDSLLSQRCASDHESSRRLKTEFLVQLDGAATTGDERILVVGATNRPGELDEAARRRMVRRLYIPLPELSARMQILRNLLQTVRNVIKEEQIVDIGSLTDGYSGSDMEMLCREASMEPIRSIPADEIPYFHEANVRPVRFEDFVSALTRVRASVSSSDLEQYTDWNRVYGSGQ